MPVAVGLVFITVTHQRDAASSAKRLEQAQRELLPVVLNYEIASVDAPTFL